MFLEMSQARASVVSLETINEEDEENRQLRTYVSFEKNDHTECRCNANDATMNETNNWNTRQQWKKMEGNWSIGLEASQRGLARERVSRSSSYPQHAGYIHFVFVQRLREPFLLRNTCNSIHTHKNYRYNDLDLRSKKTITPHTK